MALEIRKEAGEGRENICIAIFPLVGLRTVNKMPLKLNARCKSGDETFPANIFHALKLNWEGFASLLATLVTIAPRASKGA